MLPAIYLPRQSTVVMVQYTHIHDFQHNTIIMYAIYIFSLPEDACKQQYCRIEFTDVEPDIRKGEKLYAQITSNSIEKLYDFFIEQMREDPFVYCYGIEARKNQYRMEADEAVGIFSTQLDILHKADFKITEFIPQQDGAILVRTTNRQSRLCKQS